MIVKAIGLDNYEIRSTQQLENILTKLSPSTLTSSSIYADYKLKKVIVPLTVA